MKRNAIQKLMDWKNQTLRPPFFLYGIRGGGKTYLAMDFARSFFEESLYMNLEQDTKQKRKLESGCRNLLQRLAKAPSIDLPEDFFFLLANAFDIPVEYLASILIIFDEAMASEPLFQILRRLAGGEHGLFLLAITSRTPPLDDIAKNTNFLRLFPMQFDEYLQAIGSEWYAEVIQGHYQTNRKVPSIVHNELLNLFEDYLRIGGMPSAINEYLAFKSLDNIAAVHKSLYGALLLSMQNNYEESLAFKMKQVLDSVPEQLAKGNQKFQYRRIRKGATFALYRQAIQMLLMDSMLIACQKAGENASFKLFLADVGMYCSMTGAEPQDEMKKSLLDSYVLQALIARGHQPFFWESGSQARVDFVIQGEEGAIPVEIKAGENSRAKSIRIYQNQFHMPYSIKISAKNFEFVNQVKHIPYYAVFCL